MWSVDFRDIPCKEDVSALLMAFFTDGGDVKVTGEAGEGKCRLKVIFPDGTFETECPVSGDRFASKNEIKRSLYRIISEHEGRELPWGTLTGIRPTRLAMKGMDFKKEFFTSDEKIKLCFETAQREKEVLKSLDHENGWSLYLGIPFCPTRCLYCSFTAYPIEAWKEKKQAYIRALCREINAVSEMMKGRKLQTVYMGGGTPTSLEADDLKRIFEEVYAGNDMSFLRELTVEAGRPDSITGEKLAAIKECGATRICINPQTMNDRTLELIGRRHTVDRFREKFLLAREAGFDNINTDIIAGLPGETPEDVENTMKELGKLRPDDITVHSLAVKRAARLSEEKDKYPRASFEDMCRMIEITRSGCEAMGLHPYYLYRQKNMAGNFENVGYCGEGKECLYNILIMEEIHPVIGCGAGCSTKIPIGEKGVKRTENVKDPDLYIEKINDMIERKRDGIDKETR